MKQKTTLVLNAPVYEVPECRAMAVDAQGVLCGSVIDPSSTITDMKEEKLDNGFWI